ncbi:MAG: hypothetical protein M3N35_10465, partial [Candidatus Binatota bacterium]|nr:hypothetical protein [Candidatus Binatota bacterium]
MAQTETAPITMAVAAAGQVEACSLLLTLVDLEGSQSTRAVATVQIPGHRKRQAGVPASGMGLAAAAAVVSSPSRVRPAPT